MQIGATIASAGCAYLHDHARRATEGTGRGPGRGQGRGGATWLHDPVSFFGWALVFIGLGVLALVVVGLLGLRLWRAAKKLGREAARAGDSLARLGSGASSNRDLDLGFDTE